MKGLYANLPTMSDAKFAALMVDLLEAGHDNFEGAPPVIVSETLAHQAAVFLAQRYGVGVPTHEAEELLEVYVSHTPKDRLRLVRNAMAVMQERRP